jgi:hypothetical protein
MRFSIALLLLLATSVREIQHVNGFSISSTSIDFRGRNSSVQLRSSSDVDNEVVAIDDADCGCGDTGSRTTIFSGKPSNIAKKLNPRQAIRNGSIYNLYGEEVTMDNILVRNDNNNNNNNVSIVVFLRSLG